MAINFGMVKMKTYHTVVYEQPSKKTGKMLKQVSDYVDDLVWFRARVEKKGGRIISEGAPRQVETTDVYF